MTLANNRVATDDEMICVNITE